MALHYKRFPFFSWFNYSQLVDVHFAMEAGVVYPNWNPALSVARSFQALPSDHNGCADQYMYTANNMAYPVHYTQYRPVCSSDEIGPTAVAGADEHMYTTNNMAYLVDYTQYIPDCSSDNIGPSAVAEVSTPNWLRPHVTRVCGNNMEKITKKLPHIQIIQKGSKIVLEGALKEVHLAKEFLSNLTTNLKSIKVVEDVHVDRKFHGHIIGKKNARLNRIKNETFTHIYFAGHAKTTGVFLPPDVIRIQGYPMNVAAAKEAILQIAAESEVFVESSTTVAEKSTDNNATAFAGERENSDEVRETTTGIKDKVTQLHARTMLSRASIPRDMTENLEAGEQENSRHYESANINPGIFPRPDKRDRESLNVNSVTTPGSESGANPAKDDVGDETKESEPRITGSVSIDRRVHGHLIGYKGRAIRPLQNQFDVRVYFSRLGNDLVKIRGQKENVEKVRSQLLSLANHYMWVEAEKLRRKGRERTGFEGAPDPHDQL